MATQLSAMEEDDEDSAFVQSTQNTEQPRIFGLVGFIPFRLGHQLHPIPLHSLSPKSTKDIFRSMNSPVAGFETSYGRMGSLQDQRFLMKEGEGGQ
jgi:hypothetical protein